MGNACVLKSTLLEQDPLDGLAQLGRFGSGRGPPGLIVNVRKNLGMATIILCRNRHSDLVHTMQSRYGIDVGTDLRCVSGPTLTVVGSAPGRWLAISDRYRNGELARELQSGLAGLASISDQSDSRTILRLRGHRVRDILARGMPIDLHPSTFRSGSAASTVVRHVAVHLWQSDDDPTFDLAVFRSVASALWQWVVDTAAQFDFQVAQPDDPEPR